MQPEDFLAQLKEAGASSMEPEDCVKQLTQSSQESQTVRVERQVLLHMSLRMKNNSLARDSLDETERADFRCRHDKLLTEAEAEHDMFVDEDDNWSDSRSVDRLEKEACTMYVDFNEFSLSQT